MLRQLLILLAASVAAIPLHAATIAEDARQFGTRQSVWSFDLSPSGSRIVFLSAGPGRSTLAKVLDVATGREKTMVASQGNPESLDWCEFASDAQLICSYGGEAEINGMLLGFRRLVTFGVDGGDIKPLGQRQSDYDARIRQFDGGILDWLPDQPGSVLMTREYVPETGKIGTLVVRRKDGLGVDRVNLSTLAVSPVEQPRRGAAQYMTDGRGNVRVMAIEEADSEAGHLSGVTIYKYRTAGRREWTDLGRYDGRDGSGLVPLAIESDSNSLLILKKVDGRKALYRMPLEAAGTTTLIAANKQFDIDDVVRVGKGQKVIGYTFADDQRRTVYFDQEFNKLAASLGRALPSQPLITFTGANADSSKLLVSASSDTHPGTYYLLDRKSLKMDPISLSRPLLKDRKLATVRSISIPAPDGASVPAYLTIPAGSSGKNLPAIVLPHGGPSARDEWGFDWLAQFFAARGFAVIQPNFRGSAGFGDDWLNVNGFKNWRTSIGDVTAAARYLVREGIADQKRLAIVGWSYGGYAALQSAAVETDLYKAVVAIAPVTDLALLKRDHEGFTNVRLVRDFIGSGPHVHDGSPLRNVSAIRAPVLLVHGDKDINVGIDHSLKMARALKAAGRPVKMLRYEALNHQLDDSNARVEMLTRMGEFIEKATER